MSAALQAIPQDLIDEVKQRDLAPIVGQTVRLHREGRLFAGRCPFHGDKTPSFYVYPKDQHYHCFGCGAHGDAVDFVMHTRRLSFREAVAWLSGQDVSAFTPTERPQYSDSNRNAELAQKIWTEACLPEGTIVEDYLRSRRLVLPDEPVIRFHPQCPNGKDRMPAMVALMSDPETGDPRGIHRTFLRPDGSGKVSKMMLGPAGVIPLCERVTNGLGITEGIETGLAIIQRVGWGPVWAAGSAGGIRSFPVLPFTTLNIFCDHDESGVGLKAARACGQRWADAARIAWNQDRRVIECYIHIPPEGKDWDEATLGEDVP
jgi:CHC2-type zinc finger protein/Toprim domain-containing protein